MKSYYRTSLLFVFLALVLSTAVVNSQGPSNTGSDRGVANPAIAEDLFSGLRWRNIGPFHGGRISAVTGSIGQPGVYYVGTPWLRTGVWAVSLVGMAMILLQLF